MKRLLLLVLMAGCEMPDRPSPVDPHNPVDSPLSAAAESAGRAYLIGLAEYYETAREVDPAKIASATASIRRNAFNPMEEAYTRRVVKDGKLEASEIERKPN